MNSFLVEGIGRSSGYFVILINLMNKMRVRVTIILGTHDTLTEAKFHLKPRQSKILALGERVAINFNGIGPQYIELIPRGAAVLYFEMNGQEWRERYKCDALGEGPRHDYAGFPKVTLSASTEAGLRESFISVLEQRSYTGGKPVISSSLADTPCTSFSVKGLIRKLNVILGTSYTVETCSLSTLLEDYIGKGYDFGTVYGRLRPFWYLGLTDIKYKLQAREQWDRQMRRDVLVRNKIISPLIPPRRVWDLYSNRVVPWRENGRNGWRNGVRCGVRNGVRSGMIGMRGGGV
ncbi:hypothetical protein EDD85DRAFT_793369 [Armillaria nabsnona]|nr:hypothetical protein EDD85DRAFT_793369 [Armillaria nabsnona]